MTPYNAIALRSDLADRLRTLVRTLGEPHAAALLGVPRTNIVRALAGVRQRRGSIVMLEQALERAAVASPPGAA